MACDICGKVDGKALQTLNSEYQTEDVKQVCDSCTKEVNDALWKIRRVTTKMNHSCVKSFIDVMKDKFKR